MSRIGKRGYQTTVARYFDGDRQAANEWLAKTGRWAIDREVTTYGRKFPSPGPHPAHNQEV